MLTGFIYGVIVGAAMGFILGIWLEEQPMTREEVARMAQYVVNNAAHIAVAVYLFPGSRYIDYYGGLIRRLRQMRDGATRGTGWADTERKERMEGRSLKFYFLYET